MTNSGGGSRIRSISGNILMFLPTLGLAGSSLVKFAHVPGIVQKMALLGFGGEKLPFGIVRLAKGCGEMTVADRLA